MTNTPLYWEENSCISPNKKWIVYMSNITSNYPLNFNNPDWADQPRQREYWLANAVDGSNPQQLTYFNDPGAPEYLGSYGAGRISVDSCNFSSDGTSMVFTLGVDFATAEVANLQLKVAKIDFAYPSMFSNAAP